ncbi:ribonuclease Z [Candidatus Woesearchaeota archaeon]|nr:ribonuclease Z [Candidatus Woesearchaeota archaeon]
MKITFLGTSSMVPTKERNHTSIFIKYLKEGILVDCGEGTQRQMRHANIRPSMISRILLTHWHGDHVFGLPGLIQTLNNSEYEDTLYIYGPVGTKEKLKKMTEAFDFEIGFSHKIIEAEQEGLVLDKELVIKVYGLEHSVRSLGYFLKEKDRRRIKLDYIKKLGIPEGPLLGKLQENKKIRWKGKTIDPKDATYIVEGKKLSIILDTLICSNCDKIAKDADLLIAEAVYVSSLQEKAMEYMHLTAKQAALIASRNNVNELILTHFSQRYKSTEEICSEAKTYFPNTRCAYDFMNVEI